MVTESSESDDAGYLKSKKSSQYIHLVSGIPCVHGYIIGMVVLNGVLTFWLS